MGKRTRGDSAAASSSASASAAPIAVPVGTASAAPADTGSAAPVAPAPADTGSAAPADTGSAAPSAAPDAPTESTLACDPDCDEIKVDDKAIELGKPVVLEPGKHVLIASKSGYLTVRETVTVKAGQKVERTFKLREKPAAPGNSSPCGLIKPPAQAGAGPGPMGETCKPCKRQVPQARRLQVKVSRRGPPSTIAQEVVRQLTVAQHRTRACNEPDISSLPS